MKYSRLLSSLMAISAIQIAEASMPRAIANGNNFISNIDETRSQATPNSIFEPAYPVVQTQNLTPIPEAPLQDNLLQKPQPSEKIPEAPSQKNSPKEAEPKKECLLGNTSSEKLQPIEDGNIRVTGSTLLKKSDLSRFLKELKGELNPPKLADIITLFYLNKGYINSRASIPTVSNDKKIEIQVIEGRIGKIEVYGLKQVNGNYVCNRIKLGAGVPLNSSALENQLRLLRADPLFDNVEATLRAPDKLDSGEILQRVLNKPSSNKKYTQGASTLVVRVKEANPFTASVSIDNYFPPVVGTERFGVEARYRNVNGIGDEIAGSYYRSFTGGAEVWDFIYRVPLNAMNGTLQLRAAPSRNSVTQEPLDRFGVRGTQEYYEVTYRQPLIRSYNEEFALSLNFTYQNGQTFILNDVPVPFLRGPNAEGITRTSVIKFSQEYTKRDVQGAWSLRSQFSLGTGLFDATVNKAPTPDGRYFAWLAQVQRVQKLSDDHLLLLQVDLQLTPDNLLTTQQFIIGGGQSLRGYRENLRTGDNGFRFSVEDRFTLLRDKSGYATLQVAPYVDLGAVWNNGNPNPIVNENFLVNTGLGFLWNKPLGLDGLNLRFDYSIPVLATSDRGNDIQDTALYFSIRYQPW